MIIDRTKQTIPPIKSTIPTEATLGIMLENGMTEAVQRLLDIYPELKFKIENGCLVDMVKGAELHLKRFITQDSEMLDMKRDATKLASVDDEVLITGETGTGKELIARSMIGDRDGKFIAVNCAGLPTELVESELFGHKAGSFTGANISKKGMFEAAKDGVLFLDEIGELPLLVQGKLLRALQEKKIRSVGENEEKDIKCRFVCATHRNLKKMVDENLFRKDLYARISTFELHIKPLRERKKDIESIVIAIGDVLKIPTKTKLFLETYREQLTAGEIDLSLNVRSLEQALKRFNLLGKI